MMIYLTKILNNLKYRDQGNVARTASRRPSNGPRPKNRRSANG